MILPPSCRSCDSPRMVLSNSVSLRLNQTAKGDQKQWESFLKMTIVMTMTVCHHRCRAIASNILLYSRWWLSSRTVWWVWLRSWCRKSLGMFAASNPTSPSNQVILAHTQQEVPTWNVWIDISWTHFLSVSHCRALWWCASETSGEVPGPDGAPESQTGWVCISTQIWNLSPEVAAPEIVFIFFTFH